MPPPFLPTPSATFSGTRRDTQRRGTEIWGRVEEYKAVRPPPTVLPLYAVAVPLRRCCRPLPVLSTRCLTSHASPRSSPPGHATERPAPSPTSLLHPPGSLLHRVRGQGAALIHDVKYCRPKGKRGSHHLMLLRDFRPLLHLKSPHALEDAPIQSCD
ncbi:hypothetical protein ACP70R_004350 [Stipagrostis hirtigluma subsp. patula]